MIRYSVRVNLRDVIDTQKEDMILAEVYSIAEETSKKIFLKLWYRKGELTAEQVSEFVKRHEKLLEDIGTNIHEGEHETWTQRSWFNLRKSGDTSNADYRHEVVYNDVSKIITGLMVFRSHVMAMDDIRTMQKPQRAQSTQEEKPNGYRVTIRKVPYGISEQQLPKGETKNEGRDSRVPKVD